MPPAQTNLRQRADQLRDLDVLAVRFARAYASGEEADPRDLAAAIGAVQALLAATADALGAVLDARQELRATLVLPAGADEALEAAVREELSRRYGRSERLPEDPRGRRRRRRRRCLGAACPRPWPGGRRSGQGPQPGSAPPASLGTSPTRGGTSLVALLRSSPVVPPGETDGARAWTIDRRARHPEDQVVRPVVIEVSNPQGAREVLVVVSAEDHTRGCGPDL